MVAERMARSHLPLAKDVRVTDILARRSTWAAGMQGSHSRLRMLQVRNTLQRLCLNLVVDLGHCRKGQFSTHTVSIQSSVKLVWERLITCFLATLSSSRLS